MDFKDLLAISGLPGIYKMIANRSNGLMVVPVEGGKRKFVSSRKHQFTPLESISIYTTTDSAPLDDIFRSMQEKLSSLPLPEPKASSTEAEAYFKEILPEYDPYRVHTKDIKKVIKWFKALNDSGLVTFDEESKEVTSEEVKSEKVATKKEPKEPAPAKKSEEEE